MKPVFVKVMIWIGCILGVGVISGICMTLFHFKLGYLFEIGAVFLAISLCKSYDANNTKKEISTNWKCPKCGKENSGFYQKCVCGYNHGKVFKDHEITNTWHCPKCGKDNSNLYKKCVCGYDRNMQY